MSTEVPPTVPADASIAAPPAAAAESYSQAKLARSHVEQNAGSLRRNSTWMFVANLTYAACQWLMLSLLARLGNQVMVGQYVLALAITTPILALAMLQLRSIQATDTRGEFSLGEYLSLRILTLLLSVVVTLIWVSEGGYRSETAWIVMVVAISACIEAISDIFHGRLQQRERLDRVAQSILLRSLPSVVAFAVGVWLTGQLMWGVIAVAVVRGVVLATWDIPQSLRIRAQDPLPVKQSLATRKSHPLARIARLARQAFPLGLVMMLIALGAAAPRYFVEHQFGESELGIFGAIGYLSLIGATAVGAIGQAATPRLANLFASGNRSAFSGLVVRLLALGVLLGLGGVALAFLVGDEVLKIAYGSEYGGRKLILVWVMAATLFAFPASFAGYAITAARQFRIQVPLYAATVAATFAACLWWVPRWGMVGAAASLIVAAAIQLLGALLILGFIRAAMESPESNAIDG